MRTVACKDDGEVSCLLANLISELDQPCGACGGAGVVLTGTSPTGESVTVRLLPERVLEIEGGGELVDAVRERRCPYG